MCGAYCGGISRHESQDDPDDDDTILVGLGYSGPGRGGKDKRFHDMNEV